MPSVLGEDSVWELFANNGLQYWVVFISAPVGPCQRRYRCRCQCFISMFHVDVSYR
ncbi:hypothetical protein CFIMG_008642RA00001 [Ceratocystis fimbriata CBS 114723]|uniref:Uncharacterized protein n=1 Tax=Ceratocystis fimbriata CBS 114723 TaxID=1035309 RepID=A0A2C5X3L1_9PEZI|nr:hypothetical protein CFIMG_008642RA00001 [Ceratocystis fimbriata CBS 114723]